MAPDSNNRGMASTMTGRSLSGRRRARLNRSLKDAGARSAVVFLLIGGLFLWVAYLVRPDSMPQAEFWSSALSNTAFTLLAVAIVGLLWSLLGGEPITTALTQLLGEFRRSVRLFQDAEATGVQRLYVESRLVESGSWMRRLRSAHEHIDMMGITLLQWTKEPRLATEMERLVQDGVRLRILIMDRDNPRFDALLNAEAGLVRRDEIESQLRRATERYREIERNIATAGPLWPGGGLEVRTARVGAMTCQLLRMDDEMVVIPYLFSRPTDQSPLFVLRGEDEERTPDVLFNSYADQFEQLWELNRPAQIGKAPRAPQRAVGSTAPDVSS